MKKLFVVFLLLSSQAFAIPDIQHWQTHNGVRVYFMPAPELPIVDVEVVFDAGSARDGASYGLAMMTAAIMSEGAAGLLTDQILEQFAGLGAEFGSSVDDDLSSFTLRSVRNAAQLDPAIEMFTQILNQPDFPVEPFERERKRVLRSLEYQKQLPSSIASKAFYRAVFADHPYAFPADGTEESIKALTIDQLKTFYQQYYVAQNAMIVLVGQLDTAEAEKLAEAIVGKLPAGEAAPAIPPVKMLESSRDIHLEHPSTQTHVVLGQPGHSRYAEDYFALYVGNHVLGGNGLVSLLSDEVREKRGLSYSVSSGFSPMKQAGPFVLNLQTRNDQAQEAIKVAMDTLARFIEQGPSEDELNAAKQNLTGGFPLRIDSNQKLLSYISVIGFYKLPLDYLQVWTQKIEAVTAEQVRQSFQKLIHLDKLVQVTVGQQE